MKRLVYVFCAFILLSNLHADDKTASEKGLEMHVWAPEGLSVGRQCPVRIEFTNKTDGVLRIPVYTFANLEVELIYEREGVDYGLRFSCMILPATRYYAESYQTLKPQESKTFIIKIAPAIPGKATMAVRYSNYRNSIIEKIYLCKKRTQNKRLFSRMRCHVVKSVDNVWKGSIFLEISVKMDKNGYMEDFANPGNTGNAILKIEKICGSGYCFGDELVGYLNFIKDKDAVAYVYGLNRLSFLFLEGLAMDKLNYLLARAKESSLPTSCRKVILSALEPYVYDNIYAVNLGVNRIYIRMSKSERDSIMTCVKQLAASDDKEIARYAEKILDRHKRGDGKFFPGEKIQYILDKPATQIREIKPYMEPKRYYQEDIDNAIKNKEIERLWGTPWGY